MGPLTRPPPRPPGSLLWLDHNKLTPNGSTQVREAGQGAKEEEEEITAAQQWHSQRCQRPLCQQCLCVCEASLCVCARPKTKKFAGVLPIRVCVQLFKKMKKQNGACVPFPMEPSEPLIKGPTDDDRCRDDLCHAEHCLIGSDQGGALAAVARLRHVPTVGFQPTVHGCGDHWQKCRPVQHTCVKA